MINIFHCLKDFKLRKVVIIKNDMRIQISYSVELADSIVSMARVLNTRFILCYVIFIFIFILCINFPLKFYIVAKNGSKPRGDSFL